MGTNCVSQVYVNNFNFYLIYALIVYVYNIIGIVFIMLSEILLCLVILCSSSFDSHFGKLIIDVICKYYFLLNLSCYFIHVIY